MSNKEIVIRMTENFEKNNSDAMLEYFTDDIIWNMVGDMVLSGKNEIRNMMGELRFKNAPEFKTGQILEAGEHVSLINKVDAVFENGEPFKRQWCNIYRFSGGKINYIESYPRDLNQEYLEAAKKVNVLL